MISNFLWRTYRKSPQRLRKIAARLAPFAGRAIGVSRKSIRIGFDFYLNFSDNASLKYLRDGNKYEDMLVDQFLTAISLNPSSVVLDIGANYGFYTLNAAQIGRFGLIKKVFAFEPDERCVTALSRSVVSNGFEGLVQIENCIVGDSDTHGAFLSSTLASSSNRSFQSSEVTDNFTASSVTTVRAQKIDTLLQAEKYHISLEKFIIKIDIEGNEFRAFAGMPALLSKANGVFVLFEFYPVGIREVGSSCAELVESLCKCEWDQCYIRIRRTWYAFGSRDEFFSFLKELYAQNSSNRLFGADCVLARNVKTGMESMKIITREQTGALLTKLALT